MGATSSSSCEPLRDEFFRKWCLADAKRAGEALQEKVTWSNYYETMHSVQERESRRHPAFPQGGYHQKRTRRPPQTSKNDAYTDDEDEARKPDTWEDPEWNPALKTPVLFGRRADSVRRVPEEEDKYYEKRAEALRSFEKALNQRKLQRDAKLAELKKACSRERKRREAEARIAGDEEEVDLAEEAIDAQVSQMERVNLEKDLNEQRQLAARKLEEEHLRNAELGQCPGGKLLERDGIERLRRAQRELDEACAELEEAEEQLDERQTRYIHECEGKMRTALQEIDRAEKALERIVYAKEREEEVLVYYNENPLVVRVALLAVCKDTFVEKAKSIWALFLQQGNFLTFNEVKECLETACAALQLNFTRDQIESTALRAFITKNEQLLTIYEASVWLTSLVRSSPMFSELCQADHALSELSTYQRQKMPAVHAFELGLYSLNDLKYHVAKSLHSASNPTQKHDLAFSRGSRDPLKSNYSRFLHKKIPRKKSDVVPLLHGHLHNLTHVLAETEIKAVEKLQNVYRAKRARRDAVALARIEAFWHARDLAIAEAKEAVEKDFEAKEESTGVSRSKWEASVRLCQAKKRAKEGISIDRKEAVEILKGEMTQTAVSQVEEKFQAMAPAQPMQTEQDEKGPTMISFRSRLGGYLQFKQSQLVAAAKKEMIPEHRIKSIIFGDPLTQVLPREEMLMETYADPNPPLDKLAARIEFLSRENTSLKVSQMLLELPSKRLLMRYADVADLQHRFRLADTLRIVNSDFEFGLLTKYARERMIEYSRDWTEKSLHEDFLATANRIAKTIIHELFSSKKTVPVVAERNCDGFPVGRGPSSLRFQAENIWFRVARDDHGIFNGDDDAAAKAAGLYRSGAAAYLATVSTFADPDEVRVPLTATIDYLGLRVLAVSHFPELEELVLGTEDRGLTTHNSSRSLDLVMKKCAQVLNLAKHAVRGRSEVTSKMLYSSVDLRGYGNKCLLNFWRSFPAEDPDETPHLPKAPRGASIFWRQLRPDFVRDYREPLSPDANCLATRDCADADEHIRRAKDATKAMLLRLLEAPTDLHKAGINMRHLGLLRSLCWRRLDGVARCDFGSRFLRTSRDWRIEEVSRGDQLRINGKLFTVAADGPFTADQCPLESEFTEPSTGDVIVETGKIDGDRTELLVEMVARSVKALFRAHLRRTAEVARDVVYSVARKFAAEMLTDLCTNGKFWREQIVPTIRYRFGSCALNASERPKVFALVKPRLPTLLRRVSTMVGCQISQRALTAFDTNPHGFQFFSVDLELTSVVKHGIPDFEHRQALSLRQSKGMKAPHFYVPLDERPGSHRTRRLLGAISKDVTLGIPFGKEQRCARFRVGGNVLFKQNVPKNIKGMECWARLERVGDSVAKVAMMVSHFGSVAVSKEDRWTFTIFGNCVVGPLAAENKWVHVCGTFDGAMMRLFVDGIEEASAEVSRSGDDRKDCFAIGSSCPSARSRQGNHFWCGCLAQVALWEECPQQQQIAARALRETSTRFLNIAEEELSLSLRHGDDGACEDYALLLTEQLAAGICVPLDRITDKFDGEKCSKIFSKLLRALPDGPEYASYAVDIFNELLLADPTFYSRDLAIFPRRFGLDENDAPLSFRRAASRAFRIVLGQDPDLLGDFWIKDLESDEVVRQLVRASHQGRDPLRLESLQLTSADFRIVCNHRRLLTHIDLTCCQVDRGALVFGLKATSALQTLILDGCSGTDDSVLALLPSSLITLSIQNCPSLTSQALQSALNSLHRIKHFRASYTKAKCVDKKDLESLCASHCNQLFQISSLSPHLTLLDLSYSECLNDDGIFAVAEQCTQLQHLNVEGLHRLTDRGCTRITHNLWKLNRLNLKNVHLVTDAIFYFDEEGDGRVVAKQKMLRQLTSIDLSGCSRLTDRAMTVLKQRRLTSLKVAGLNHLTNILDNELMTLDVSGCCSLDLSLLPHTLTSLNVSGLVALASIREMCEICTKLKSLNLSRCRRLNDALACSIVDHLWLDDLRLAYLPRLTDTAIELLVIEQRGLKILDISHCTSLTKASLRSIGSHAKRLDTLFCDHRDKSIGNILNVITTKTERERYELPAFLRDSISAW